MAEDPRLLLHFKTLAKFKEKLADGTINPDKHFVIIKDEKLIWIRGVYYADNSKLENITSLYNDWSLSLTSTGVEITLKGKLWNETTRKWDNISKILNTTVRNISLTGPITGTTSFDDATNASIATTITNDSVTNSKLANMAANTIKGNDTANAGDPNDLSTTLVRAMLSISNVNNTSDADKPVSTATQTALNGKVDKTTTINGHALSSNVTVTASDVGLGSVTNESKATMFTNPAFTGTPTAPTAAAGTNTTLVATTAFVNTAVSVNSANIANILSKLNGIASGAEVNIQSDWNVTDSSSDAFVKNKPTSMPASDVYNWAKSATKPSYSWSEITSKPSFATVATTGSYSDLTGTPGNATSSASGLMSGTDKSKLDGLLNYILPNATNLSKGGVIVGQTLQISNGVISSLAIKGSITCGLEGNVTESGIYLIKVNNSLAGWLFNVSNIVLYRISVINNIDVLSNEMFYSLRTYSSGAWGNWTSILPTASSSVLGGVKIGYTQSGKNYPVKLDSNSRMYVNVPWTSGNPNFNYEHIIIPIGNMTSINDSTYGLCDGLSTGVYMGASDSTSSDPVGYTTQKITNALAFGGIYITFMPCLLINTSGKIYIPLLDTDISSNHVLYPTNIVHKGTLVIYNFMWHDPKSNALCVRSIIKDFTNKKFIVTKEKQATMTVI